MSDFKKITISTKVNVSIDQAWKVFTSPSSIVKWNFASQDWCCPRASIELCEGGLFNYRMESRDGKFGFDFSGTFTLVVPGSRIDYVLGDERTVSVEFRKVGESTEVIETFDAETDNSLELQRNGWQAILDNFKRQAEATG